VTTIVLLVVAFLLLPLVVFRGGTLRRYLAFDVASYAFGAAAWWLVQPPDEYFALIVFAVAKLAAFCVALAGGREVVWSANRGAVLAAIVFAFVVPTQMRTPTDGDESFYLLMTESIVHDHDLDLSNQYRHQEHSATGRTDLRPQVGDSTGPRGEEYSRLEPFLPALLVPGYMAARLPGALFTIALFGVLLVRSTLRLLEEQGIEDTTVRSLFPLFAFGPPVVFYAARIWPEVPGAWFFVEALRGVRERRPQRWAPALIGLSLLKLRFVLIAIGLVLTALWRYRDRMRLRRVVIAAAVIALPLVIAWVMTGSPLSGHALSELRLLPLRLYAEGFFGLFLDGMSGILFQAPLYMLGVFAIARWRTMPESFRIGCAAALPYIVSLVPRSEWHGGWSPPLRYIVVFMPLLLIGAAALWQQVRAAGYFAPAALWTIGLTIHGLIFPWRLFHIENGENIAGEWLSSHYASDFSRLFPSFIRTNEAATVASIALVIAFALFATRRALFPQAFFPPLVALVLTAAFVIGRSPGRRIEFEDAHVVHSGGDLTPQLYTVARFMYRSGWMVRPGNSLSFLARGGASNLVYACAVPSTITMGGRQYTLAPTGNRFGSVEVQLPRDGRITLTCVSGMIDLDRMDHD
jgi:hypothetical protein